MAVFFFQKWKPSALQPGLVKAIFHACQSWRAGGRLPMAASGVPPGLEPATPLGSPTLEQLGHHHRRHPMLLAVSGVPVIDLLDFPLLIRLCLPENRSCRFATTQCNPPGQMVFCVQTTHNLFHGSNAVQGVSAQCIPLGEKLKICAFRSLAPPPTAASTSTCCIWCVQASRKALFSWSLATRPR